MLFFSFRKEVVQYSSKKKNCIHHVYIDDVALPLSLQKFILGICTIQKLTFRTTSPFGKTTLLVLTPSENLTSNPFRESHL